MTYLYLAIAIIAEVVGTSVLKASAEFTKLYPSTVVIAGYSLSFYFMTLVLPLGITYAIWSGVGIVLVSAIIGMSPIISGAIVIHLFSTTIKH